MKQEPTVKLTMELEAQMDIRPSISIENGDEQELLNRQMKIRIDNWG